MTLIKDLQTLLGPDHVCTDEHVLAPMLLDNRDRFHGKACAVVMPGSTSEVSEVMKLCARHNALVFTQGGNTGNAAAATPVVSDQDAKRSILLNLKRMNAIESIDPVNDTATVQAGVIVENLQNAAAQAGRLFAVSLAAQGSCTVGGILAPNAGGVHVLHYGNSREQCLGLEVVTADGTILNLMRGLRKDNTGYDLKDLFIGSEGTLGVITRAVLKLHARPVCRTVLVVACDELKDIEPLFTSLSSELGPQMTAFELMHRDTIAMVRKMMPDVTASFSLDGNWYVLVEFSFTSTSMQAVCEETLSAALEPLFDSGTVSDAVISQSESQCEALWKIRESIPSAHKHAGGNVKHDISVPRSRLTDFVLETNRRLQNTFEWIAPSVFGHFGDGNLHYNMGVRAGFDPRLCFEHEEAIHDIVYENVVAYDGSIAAEHGIGRLKADLLTKVKAPAEIAFMHALKNSFDPQWRLNPGAVLVRH